MVERREITNGMVVLKLHCNACRYDLIFWTGSKTEEKIFKRKRNFVAKAFSAAARGLSGGGD